MSFEPGPECRTPRTCRAGQACEEVGRLMHATMQGTMGSWAALVCGFSPEKSEAQAIGHTVPECDAHRGGDSYEASMLRNLLARIHRDGGHYVEEHGLDKAMEDADAKVVEWQAALWSQWQRPQGVELASAPPPNFGELVAQCETQLLAMAAEVDRLQALMETARRERVVVAWMVREIDTEHPLLSFEANAVAASITKASWAADGFESEIVELFE